MGIILGMEGLALAPLPLHWRRQLTVGLNPVKRGHIPEPAALFCREGGRLPPFPCFLPLSLCQVWLTVGWGTKPVSNLDWNRCVLIEPQVCVDAAPGLVLAARVCILCPLFRVMAVHLFIFPRLTRGDRASHKHSLKSPAGTTWSEINALCMLIAERGNPWGDLYPADFYNETGWAQGSTEQLTF